MDASFRIETECRQGVLGKRIGALSEDTMGYALARYDRDALLAVPWPANANAMACSVPGGREDGSSLP
ncbi:MAG TPA: hypothetical protein VF863_08455 [Candidatus Acidoferrum sp.]